MITLAKAKKDNDWLGEVMAIHSIGRFDLVEYTQMEHGKVIGPKFTGYVDGVKTSRSYDSLEAGIVGCIAFAALGPNSQAAWFFMKMIAPDNSSGD